MPPVPYTTETLAELQARYPRALEFVFDQEAIQNQGAIRPGEVAAQVFDFEDGLRMIVSREQEADGKLLLHLSASFRNECAMADKFLGRLRKVSRSAALEEWRVGVELRFAELASDRRPFRFLGWSGNMIPHWIREED